MVYTRILAALLSVFCLCTVPVFAATPRVEKTIETICFEDGTYLQITTTETENMTRSSAKRVYRDYNYYVDNKLAVCYTLTGIFEYDGKTSKATDVTASASIYQSGWSLKSHHESRSGNRIYGTATFSGPNGDKTLSGSITCDKDGNIS